MIRVPYRSRKYAALIAALILAVTIIAALLFKARIDAHPIPPTAGFLIRCGGWPVALFLAVAAASSLAWGVDCLTLIYTVLKRERGHALNGLTISHAAASAAVAFVCSTVFWNLSKAPCWVTVAIYALSLVAAAVKAVHTMSRRVVLIETPSITIDDILAKAKKDIRAINQKPHAARAPENERLMLEIIAKLEGMNSRSAVQSSEGQ